MFSNNSYLLHYYFIILIFIYDLGEVIPELLRNDTGIANVLKFSLHSVTLLSQLDPKDFPHLINKNSIAESYRGFFQIFGGHHVNLLFSGFQDYFQTLTKLFIFDDLDHH